MKYGDILLLLSYYDLFPSSLVEHRAAPIISVTFLASVHDKRPTRSRVSSFP